MTIILRVNDVRKGIRGTVELPGGESRVFTSDDELMDVIYEWTSPAETSENGSGSISSSAMRVT